MLRLKDSIDKWTHGTLLSKVGQKGQRNKKEKKWDKKVFFALFKIAKIVFDEIFHILSLAMIS